MPGPSERELLAAALRAEAIRDNPETDPDAVARAEALADDYRTRAAAAREGELRRDAVVDLRRQDSGPTLAAKAARDAARSRFDEQQSERAGFGERFGGRELLDYERASEDEEQKKPRRMFGGSY